MEISERMSPEGIYGCVLCRRKILPYKNGGRREETELE